MGIARRCEWSWNWLNGVWRKVDLFFVIYIEDGSCPYVREYRKMEGGGGGGQDGELSVAVLYDGKGGGHVD